MRPGVGKLLLFFLAVAGPAAAAAQETNPNLEACAAEHDDRLRLACYDAEVGRLAGLEPASAAGRPDQAADGSSANARQGRPQSGDADAFGMTPALARSMKEKSDDEPEELRSLAAVVSRIDEQPYGERLVYLDNGQVWEEISRNRNLRLAVGDDITVKSAAFGSYKLIGPGGKRFTRVRRIR